MELMVRFVTRADYAQWLPLWEGYNRFYGRYDATALPDAITQMTWSRFFDGYEPVHASNATARRLYDSVAEDSGFVVYRKRLQ